jgi:glycosyltransferase involved in cell wall biosynthesis
MRFISTVRTYNEAEHIEKFCQSYSEFADVILVADGGSEDNTKELASKYPKVKIRDYTVKVECKNGIWRNPDGPHIQFLIDWAQEEGADWIVHQDCDQRPNKYLKQDIRKMLEETDKDFILVTQIFLWGSTQYFRSMSNQGSGWMQGLWAWRANINMKIIDKMPHYEFSYDGVKPIDIDRSDRILRTQPPYCFMHYGWESAEKTQSHVEYYRNSGLIPNMTHPLHAGGTPSNLEEWMIE